MPLEDREDPVAEQHEEAAEGGDVGGVVSDPPQSEGPRQPRPSKLEPLGLGAGVVPEVSDGGNQLGGDLGRFIVVRPGRGEVNEDVGHDASVTGE